MLENRLLLGYFSTVYVALMFIFSSSNVLDKSLLSLSKTMEGGQRVSQGKNITTLLAMQVSLLKPQLQRTKER